MQKVLEHSVLLGFLSKLHFLTLSDLCKTRLFLCFASCVLDKDESGTSLPVACGKIPLHHPTREAARCSTYTLYVRAHLDWQLKQIGRQITCVGVTVRAIPRRTEIWEDDARSAISLHVESTILWTERVHGWMWEEGRQLLCDHFS